MILLVSSLSVPGLREHCTSVGMIGATEASERLELFQLIE